MCLSFLSYVLVCFVRTLVLLSLLLWSPLLKFVISFLYNFLCTFYASVPILGETDGNSCVEPKPYISSNFSMASAVGTLTAGSQLLCPRKTSSASLSPLCWKIFCLVPPCLCFELHFCFHFYEFWFVLEMYIHIPYAAVGSHVFVLKSEQYWKPSQFVASENLLIARVAVVMQIVSSAYATSSKLAPGTLLLVG